MVDPWQTEKKKKVHTHKKQPHDRNESEDSPNILPKWRKLNSPVTFKLIKKKTKNTYHCKYYFRLMYLYQYLTFNEGEKKAYLIHFSRKQKEEILSNLFIWSG